MKRHSSCWQLNWSLLRVLASWLGIPYQRVLRVGRYWYWRLNRIKASPEYLARGLAIGVFAGCFPLFGLQIPMGVLLAVPLRGHKLTAALGTWVSNPLTYVPLYLFNFRVGCWLLESGDSFTSESLQSLEALLELKKESIAALFVGCFVSGLVASVSSYLIAIRLIRSGRSRRRHRRSTGSHRRVSSKKPMTPHLGSPHSKSIDLS